MVSALVPWVTVKGVPSGLRTVHFQMGAVGVVTPQTMVPFTVKVSPAGRPTRLGADEGVMFTVQVGGGASTGLAASTLPDVPPPAAAPPCPGAPPVAAAFEPPVEAIPPVPIAPPYAGAFASVITGSPPSNFPRSIPGCPPLA